MKKYVVVTCGLSDYKLMTKLKGLYKNPDIDRLVLIRKKPLNNIDKIFNVNPPVYFRWLLLFECWRFFTLLKWSRKKEVVALLGIQLVIHGVQAKIVGFICRRPVVISVIGSDVHKHLLVKWSRCLLRLFVRYADMVTVMGDKSRSIIAGLGVANIQITLLQNYQDTERYCYNIRNKQWDLIFIGELLPRKRVSDLLVMIAKNPVTLTAVIVGDGELMASLKRQAEQLGIADSVDFVGYSDRPEKYLEQSKVLVLPSELEALPAVVVEAMYCGVPAVVTAICDIPSQFEDGEGCYLFDVGDIAVFQEKVNCLLASETFYQQAVGKCLDWSQVHQKMWDENAQISVWNTILNRIQRQHEQIG